MMVIGYDCMLIMERRDCVGDIYLRALDGLVEAVHRSDEIRDPKKQSMVAFSFRSAGWQ